MTKVVCPYCNADANKVTGRTIYPHRSDLHTKVFYLCQPCAAYVGCHPGTDKPLGRLADATLRRLKSEAHAAFDPIWRNGGLSRSAAYAWLSTALDLPKEKTHIGMFDDNLCQRVVVVCNARGLE